jgi:hypothetical protein
MIFISYNQLTLEIYIIRSQTFIDYTIYKTIEIVTFIKN